MIPGLEYERAAPAHAADPSYAASSPSAHSLSSVDMKSPSPCDAGQGLHRRRPHSSVNGQNGSAGHLHGGGDDDKYGKRARGVRRLDIFPKTEPDYTVRTERGGQLTAAGYVIMTILILAEWLTWSELNRESLEHIVVDKSLGKRMRVNINITFPALHCDDLHLDVIDVAGDSQIDMSDKMFKQRLNLDGRPKKHDLIVAEANVKAEEDRKHREALEKKVPENYCGPCYGAHQTEDECCNTCDDVLAAYKKKRWNEGAVQPLAEQCIREGRGKNEPKRMSKGEGCNLSGHFTVNRVAGNFHIAMGQGVNRGGSHIHQFLPEDRVNFNASHSVHELSFMDAAHEFQPETSPTKVGINGEKTMNGVHKVVTAETGTTGLFQYFIKVVPTKYKGDIIDEMGVPLSQGGGAEEKLLETNRYFYTERYRPLIGEVHEEAILGGDPDGSAAAAFVGGKMGGTLHEKAEHHASQNAVLPGVFFVYEIYPFAVEVTRNRVPLMHLWIRIMATVGGVFTIMSMIDGVLYRREKKGRQ